MKKRKQPFSGVAPVGDPPFFPTPAWEPKDKPLPIGDPTGTPRPHPPIETPPDPPVPNRAHTEM